MVQRLVDLFSHDHLDLLQIEQAVHTEHQAYVRSSHVYIYVDGADELSTSTHTGHTIQVDHGIALGAQLAEEGLGTLAETDLSAVEQQTQKPLQSIEDFVIYRIEEGI